MSFRFEKFKIALRRGAMPGFLFRLRARLNKVPDAHLYNPTFQPWRGLPRFQSRYDEIRNRTLITPESAWILYSLARQALGSAGAFLEAGVYRGGTARLLRRVIEESGGLRRLYLFDTFAGMPATRGDVDLHKSGDFADTSLEAVAGFVGGEDWIIYRKGLIPDTFAGLESERFAFAHIDVDIFQSVADCCRFIYDRLTPGGILLFDDYGLPSCPGARAAVDEFFSDKSETPLVLHSGQAVVVRHPKRAPEHS